MLADLLAGWSSIPRFLAAVAAATDVFFLCIFITETFMRELQVLLSLKALLLSVRCANDIRFLRSGLTFRRCGKGISLTGPNNRLFCYSFGYPVGIGRERESRYGPSSMGGRTGDHAVRAMTPRDTTLLYEPIDL